MQAEGVLPIPPSRQMEAATPGCGQHQSPQVMDERAVGFQAVASFPHLKGFSELLPL